MTSEKPPALKKVYWFFKFVFTRLFFSTSFFYFFTRSIFGLKRLLCNRRLEVELLRASQPHLVFEGPRSAVAADAAAASGTKKTFVRHFFGFLFERRQSTWPGGESKCLSVANLGSHPCRRRWNEKWFVVRGASLRNRVPHSHDFCWHLSHWHLTFLFFWFYLRLNVKKAVTTKI